MAGLSSGSGRLHRDTLFAHEDGMCKHRLTDEELDPLLVELSYEEFVDYHLDG